MLTDRDGNLTNDLQGHPVDHSYAVDCNCCLGKGKILVEFDDGMGYDLCSCQTFTCAGCGKVLPKSENLGFAVDACGECQEAWDVEEALMEDAS